ncbi:MAG: pilus assembly protein PilM [Candidatus Falkowbacteria bacterium]
MFNLFKKSVGIDISDRTIEIAEMSGNKVLNLGRTSFGDGIVSRGRIKNEEKLLEIVKKMLANAKPKTIKIDKIIFLLPEALAYNFHITLKNVSKKEKDQFILEEIKKNIPLPKEDLAYNYQEIGNQEILVAAADKDVLQEWQRFFKKLQIEIEFFDIEVLAACRALFDKEIKESVCVLDIGSTTSNIAIFDKSGLSYSYAVQLAGEKFTQDLANELKIDLAKAEEKKKIIDLKSGDKEANILIKSLELILYEVKKSINYYQANSKQKISKIILIGGSSKIKGIVDYLSANLDIKVEIGRSKLQEKNTSRVYIGAVGSALQGNKRKDLIIKAVDLDKKFVEQPVETKQKSEKNINSSEQAEEQEITSSSNSKVKILIIILIAGALLVGLAFWYRSYKRSHTEEIKRKAQEVAYYLPVMSKNDIIKLVISN